ncbi:MAG: large subunit ribosomal protein L13 [Parcubacteria group bacterium Athens0714_26]|nr:MAG: large subunit ribosomal protein L13 [Parcubacteria group bacterium Athens1014_26]TSD03525.1 MAG: large subunit ribosomal protein L13 [Parcubacteria group bacterium Athens0714_26]
MDYIIDAKNKRLGRLASEIAIILQGKKTPFYEPRLAGGDNVTVKNVSEISFTGSKLDQKIYYRHTGYMGHLKEKNLKEAFSKSPAKVLRLAVMRMLPKNFLRAKRIKRLTIE